MMQDDSPPQPSIDRLPPNDPEAEKAVLGCMLLDPINVVPQCISVIGSKREIFYDLRHQELYRVLVEMYDAQEAIDTVTVHSWLGFQGLVEQIGGVSYLATLTDAAPSAANAEYYLDIISDKFKTRRLISLCVDHVSTAYDNGTSGDDLINSAATKILGLANDSAPKEEESELSALLAPAMEQIEAWSQSNGQVSGVATGLIDLDRITTGFHPGQLIIIAGRPGFGKTSLAMNIVDHAAVEQGLPIGVFSLEMTKADLAVRMICARARVNIRNVQHGFMTQACMHRMAIAAGRLQHSKIIINDQAGLSITGLRARARRMHQQHGIRLFVVDYLQLMNAERRKTDNREQEVGFISSGLKGLAKDLSVPVIALSQLNRTIERDKERRPRLSDLRESGAIENDADMVGILWNPSQDRDEEQQDAVPVNLEICKQRSGPTGTVPLTFLRCFTRFESAAKVDSSPGNGYETHNPADQEQVQQPELQV
jgi:replicative DNA helicase